MNVAEVIERDGSLPDFLIIGVQKSGTTALSMNLSRHPDVYMAGRDGRPQEIHFFNSNWRRGLDWYRQHFTHPEKLQGDRTPNYLSDTISHARMAATVPNAKLVITLRNPTDRAYSHWNHFNQIAERTERWGWTVMPFRDAIEQRHIPIMNAILDAGQYMTKINQLLTHYARDKIHILIAERLRASRETEYAALLRFLGLGPSTIPFKDVHTRSYTQPLEAETREYLASYFADSNEELFEFLGDAIPEWR
jgi:hypothetical protein